LTAVVWIKSVNSKKRIDTYIDRDRKTGSKRETETDRETGRNRQEERGRKGQGASRGVLSWHSLLSLK